MKERPIIFSAPMVRAVLGGKKTQTRRIIKLPHNNPLGVWEATTVGGHGCYTKDGKPYPERAAIWHTRTGTIIVPPFAVGDRFWVREACRAEELPTGIDGVRYAADDAWRVIENTPEASDDWVTLFHYRGRGRGRIGDTVPPIYMPRWASRITLEVTEVKVERLQDISETDATAEGCRHHHDPDGDGQNVIEQFSYLWQSIHGPGSWEENSWVAAISFRRVSHDHA